ncbi:hypothetical protein [Achromobacter anxifer]
MMHHASSAESAESVITRAGLSPAIASCFYIIINNQLVISIFRGLSISKKQEKAAGTKHMENLTRLQEGFFLGYDASY